MAKLVWDAVGEHLYETGVDQGVLYPWDSTQNAYGDGVAWNGLTTITETPSGADFTAIYADNIKYLNLQAAEEFGGTIEAYTYPDEWMECDGSAEIATGAVIGQQARKSFGLCYRTKIGNDVDSSEHGYKLHIVYGCLATPSERAYQTINDSPEAISFSWEFQTTPVPVLGANGQPIAGTKPTSIITIDSTKANATKLAALEAILYGTDATTGTDGAAGTAATTARLPLPAEVISTLS